MATGDGNAISVECGGWLYADGSGATTDPYNPHGVAHHKVLATGTYQGVDWWRYKISANDALAGGPFIYVKVTSGSGQTKIVDEKGKRIDHMNYYLSGPESSAIIGPTGPGSADRPNPTKVICAELHRQGLMDEAIWRADEAFGEYLRANQRDVLLGYQLWAKPVVKWMQKSKTVTKIVAAVATPWSYEMAYRMGVRHKGSFAGKILMDVGLPVCRTIGKVGFGAGVGNLKVSRATMPIHEQWSQRATWAC